MAENKKQEEAKKNGQMKKEEKKPRFKLPFSLLRDKGIQPSKSVAGARG